MTMNPLLSKSRNQKIIEDILKLHTSHLQIRAAWLYICSENKFTLLKMDQNNQKVLPDKEVTKLLTKRCYQLNEPAYLLGGAHEVKSISSDSSESLNILLPLDFKMNDEKCILIINKTACLFRKDDDAEKIIYLNKVINLLTYKYSDENDHQKNNNQNSPTDSIMLQDRNSGMILPVQEIIYCEADGNYTNVYLKNIKKPVLKTILLKKLIEYLPNDDFIRIHKSVVVNKNFIKKYDFSYNNSYITLIDEKKLVVAIRRKQALIEALKENNLIV